MRTTVNLDPDVEAAINQIRREQQLGVSDAVNALVRRGLSYRPSSGYRYTAPVVQLGMTVDVANIGEVLDLLDRD